MKKKSSRYVIPPSHFSIAEVTIASKKSIETIPASEGAEVITDASDIVETPSVVEAKVTPTPPEVSELENLSEKKEEKVIERPQILAERNAKKVSALSIKSIQKKNQMKQELVANKPDAKNLPFDDFTLDEMLVAWQSYSTIIEDEGKYNLHSHLSMGVPKLEGSIIHLEFPNHTIKLEVERAKHELLGFLREKLNNYDVTLSIEVNETSAKRYAYTDREKFEKLKEINPLMDTLRKEFDLDV